jgi:hypothetical protein
MTSQRLELSACSIDGKIHAIGGFQRLSNAFPAVEVLDVNPVVDFNGDGVVDIDDLLSLIESWGQNDPLVDIGPRPLGDGTVDVLDLEVFMGYWGQELVDPTLLASWKLDETGGDVAYDSIGTNDALVVGDLLWSPEGGQSGGALGLDGIDDYAQTEFVLGPADGPFSVFAWVVGGLPGQVAISQEGGANWLTRDPSTGALATELNGEGRLSGPLTSQIPFAPGNWHRIGLVWDGLHRTLYVDDLPVAEDTQATPFPSLGGLHFGTGAGLQPGSFWAGLIDDIQIYRRVVRP